MAVNHVHVTEMIKYEKIALLIVSAVVVAGVALSYHEWSETRQTEQVEGPNFAASLGPSLKLGPFTTVLSQSASGPRDPNCTALQPVITSTLHDIDQRLIARGTYQPGVFQVNQQSLELFCHHTASITLSSQVGVKLILVKQPPVRTTPPGASADNVGTKIHIDATVVQPGTVPPTTPTTYGDEVIPDRFLGIQ